MERRIDHYDLPEGRTLGSNYTVLEFLGRGYEGEVYKVVENRTGIERAAKLFYPPRNPKGKALLQYAAKLNRLKHIPVLIQYHHRDTARVRGQSVEFMVSEYVHGEVLERFLKRYRAGRMGEFEALHVLYALARGVAPIHEAGEYHGDLHPHNIVIRRKGVGFEVKLLDFFDLGRSTRERIADDVIDLAGLLYLLIGGAKGYARASEPVKCIVCGRRRATIAKRYPHAGALVRALQTLEWPT